MQAAILSLEKSNSINSSDVETLLSLAKIYEEINLYEKAYDYMYQAEKLDSSNLRLLKQMARVSYKNKDYELVLKRVKSYLAFAKDTSYYQLKLLGIAYFQTENFTKAVETLEKVIAEGYETEVVYYYLGLSYKNLNDFERSEACFEYAIDKGVSKNISNYYTNLAILYEEQGKYQKSIANYQISYKFSNNKELLYHLARNYDAYYKDKTTSLKYFERYLSMNDSDNLGFMNYSKYRISELKKAIHFDIDTVN